MKKPRSPSFFGSLKHIEFNFITLLPESFTKGNKASTQKHMQALLVEHVNKSVTTEQSQVALKTLHENLKMHVNDCSMSTFLRSMQSSQRVLTGNALTVDNVASFAALLKARSIIGFWLSWKWIVVDLESQLKSSISAMVSSKSNSISTQSPWTPQTWIDHLVSTIVTTSAKDTSNLVRLLISMSDIFTNLGDMDSLDFAPANVISTKFRRVQGNDESDIILQAQCVLAYWLGLRFSKKEGNYAWAYRGYFINAIMEVCLILLYTAIIILS